MYLLPKGRAWMNRASKTRVSVWNVSDKHPGTISFSLSMASLLLWPCFIQLMNVLFPLGYNASDSDSDESKGDAK